MPRFFGRVATNDLQVQITLKAFHTDIRESENALQYFIAAKKTLICYSANVYGALPTFAILIQHIATELIQIQAKPMPVKKL